MKRTLVLLPILVAVSALAFQPPKHAELPNFDRRTDNVVAPPAEFAAAEKGAVEKLKSRVPRLEVTTSKVLARPNYFSSRDGFLTGPAGEGLAVEPQTAKSFANDVHGPVKAFLAEHKSVLGYGAEVLKDAQVRRDYVDAHNKLRTVVWEQQVNGVPVFEGILKAHITQRGELVNVFTEFVPDAPRAAASGMKAGGAAAAPALSASEALRIAAQSIGEEVLLANIVAEGAANGPKRAQVFHASPLKGDQYVELTWVPVGGGAMRLCWQVIAIGKAVNAGYLLLVDSATGDVILRRCLTTHISDATYNVFPSDSPSPFSPGHNVPSTVQPPLVARTLITTPALNVTASPNGWIDDGVNEPNGNNVNAYADLNDDDQPDLPRPQGNPNRVFDFPLDLTQDPTNFISAAVVNLFYWNNVIHDRLYELGFTEAAGNFQVNNFGRGGLGGDPVHAQALDGAAFKDIFHVDNANMLTPPDGFPPRMQMYAFTGPDPDRDGDYDAEVITHEYCHGLSHRLVGGGNGIAGNALQTHGMGEGWSDFFGLCMLSETNDPIDGNWAVGGYLTFDGFGTGFRENYYFGIRRYPYSTNLLKNPLTFKDIDPTQQSLHPGIPRSPLFPTNAASAARVHNQGEVWCVTLWEMRANLVAKYGNAAGNQLAMQLVVDGMKLGPANPNFLQARDAILLADRVNNASANYAEVWRAFAKRGMGGSATSPDSSTTIGVYESFDLPGLSVTTVAQSDGTSGNGNGAIDPNECVELTISVRNNSVNVSTSILAQLVTTTPNVIVSQGTAAYPDLLPNAVGQNLTPFRIYTTPNFVCGTPIELALILSAPGQVTTTNRFQLRSGFVSLNAALLNNNTPVNIPDNNTNGVDSVINVGGFSGAIGKVTVSLHLTHTFVGDLRLQLISPDGTLVTLARNNGLDGDSFGTNCTPSGARTSFDDNAGLSIGFGNAPFLGSYRPIEPLSAFVGKSGAAANGAWRLRIIDEFAQDTGMLRCWTLALHPTVCTDGGGSCDADIAVSATATPAPALQNLDLTYRVAVTNQRAIAANNVRVTNAIPAGTTFVSANASQGSCTFNNGTVICSLGTLAGNAGASVTIVLQPNSVGSLTNVIRAGGSGSDANATNNVARVVSTVIEAAPLIVAAGAQLTAESFSPATGGIESGETVTLNLTLRNNGSAGTSDLIASLLDGNGVSAASGPQSYGAVPAGGSATRAFTFTAAALAGSGISATLELQDGVRNLGSVTFHFMTGGEVTFDGGAIVINELGTASPYPSTINVSGVQGVISKVRVTFTKLTHSFPDDIDALLAGPRGQKLVLMSDAGGSTAITNRTITFDPAAAVPLPDEGALVAGNFLPVDYNSGTEPGGDVFPAPAPVGARASSLMAFNSTDPNGMWSLFIHDDGGGDAGAVSGGWSLAISAVSPINPVANLAVSAVPSRNPAVVGEPLSYTITVANLGPSNATSVILSNTIAANSSFVSSAVSQGSATFAAGTVLANLGTITNGGSATVTVAVTPTSSGSVMNRAVAMAASVDLDASNNVITTTVNAVNPVADLAVNVTAQPSPVFVSSNITFTAVVTNRGPNSASAVRLTNVLASQLSFVSATNTHGTAVLVGGAVMAEFASLAANSSATVTIVANAQSAGSASNVVTLASATSDSNPANNATNVIVTVNPMAPLIAGAGSAFVSESIAPANGAIEPGETVTLNIGLRNVGTADAGNLTATLQASGGVNAPSGAQTYGALVANGPTVSRPFTFTASGSGGGAVTFTLALQDGPQNLGTVTFQFRLSGSESFANGNVIIIPNQGAATNYPSTLTVSGVTGTVSKVTVRLNQLTHTFPEDIDALLVGPAGQKVLLMSDAGAGNAVSSVTLTLSDGASALPFATAITSGTYRPTDYAPGDNFPAPAPAGPYATNLAVFNGANPNGAWSLYVFDDAAGDAGRISGGWTLEIQTATPIAPAADIAVSVSAPATVASGEIITYTATVANHGPAAANGVVLNDTLPAGFTLNNVAVSQGSFSTSAGTVTATLGTLASGASATVTITGVGSGPRSLTNRVVASSAQTEVNAANNVAVSVTLVSAPSLTIRRSGNSAIISWRAEAGFALEGSANSMGPWTPAGVVPTTTNGVSEATVPATGTRFFRLRKP